MTKCRPHRQKKTSLPCWWHRPFSPKKKKKTSHGNVKRETKVKRRKTGGWYTTLLFLTRRSGKKNRYEKKMEAGWRSSIQERNFDGEMGRGKFLFQFNILGERRFVLLLTVKRTRKPNRRDHALHNPFVIVFSFYDSAFETTGGC